MIALRTARKEGKAAPEASETTGRIRYEITRTPEGSLSRARS